jgi:alpha-L-arabinofuranosidase
LLPAVNPTYTAIGAVPASLSATINAAGTVHTVSTTLLGVNLAWWDDQLTTSTTQQLVSAAGLAGFRFPGGSSSDDFHFNVASNYGDPVAVTIPQFAQFVQTAGGAGVVTLDYGSGSPQEAAAELAYLEGSPTDSTVIGNGLEWSDSARAWQTVNWQTVGYWAGLRAAKPLSVDDGLNFLRLNQSAPFANVIYWEVGNEEYGSWEIDHHGTAGPGGVSTGAQHDPATYAAFARAFAGYAAEIDPHLLIGIDSGDPNAASYNSWTSNVLKGGLALGFVPGFISDHSYMQAPGSESDTFLLQDTVSNPSSVLDWATRYADYQTLLQADLGSQSGNVRVMATEFNSVYANPGKQSTSLVNALFIADSIGSLLSSGYTGGFVWDLRNGWGTGDNNSPSLYGWRQGGDYGLLGDPNLNSPPSTGAYIPYPSYFAEQLASKMVLAGGTVVSAGSNFSGLDVYAVKEANGHLELLVINKDHDAAIIEPFAIQGFTPSAKAQVWQYAEPQDYAQSQSATGAAALASLAVTLPLSGNNFSYSFPAYSMTVLDLSPSVSSGGAAPRVATTLAAPATYHPGSILAIPLAGSDMVSLHGRIVNRPLPSTAASHDATANQTFVAQVYLELRGRPVDPSGLAAFSGYPDASFGLSDAAVARARVVASIEGSREYHGHVVSLLDNQFLGRDADPFEGATLTYRPGDKLWLDVPVQRGDEADWLLRWARSRSQAYQFERITEQPRLHRKDQVNTEGELQEGVAIEVVPEGGVPKVPDLVPWVPVKS